MPCRICGDENATFRGRSCMVLCPSCHRDTPAKVSRLDFDRLYWGAEAESVPLSTRNEFYDDYRCSRHGSVSSYRAATVSEA